MPRRPRNERKGRRRRRRTRPQTVHLAPGITGRGDYSILGNLGKRLGGWAGAKLGKLVGKITGIGDYQVTQNSLYQSGESKTSGGPLPRFAHGNMRIRDCEFLRTIDTGTDFDISSIPINPGLRHSFPRLSSKAAAFVEYRIHGMVFFFRSSSAVAVGSTDTALGNIMMGVQYNPDAPAWESEQDILAATYSVVGRPADHMMAPVECDPRVVGAGTKYVRTGELESGHDQALYDHGIFNYAAEGSQSISTAGQLWVAYDIELMNPSNNVRAGRNLPQNYWLLDPSTIGGNNLLGTGTITQRCNHIGGSVSSGRIYNFPKGIESGTYEIQVYITGSNASLAAPGTPFTVTNGTLSNLYQGGTASYKMNTGNTSNIMFILVCVTVTAPDCTVEFNTGWTHPASPTLGEMMVVQVNPTAL